MFEDEAELRILETIARYGGYAFQEGNGNGALDIPCQGTEMLATAWDRQPRGSSAGGSCAEASRPVGLGRPGRDRA